MQLQAGKNYKTKSGMATFTGRYKEDGKPIFVKTGGVRAFVKGAEKDLSFGFNDEIRGGLKTLFNDKGIDKNIEEVRQKEELLKQANPKSFTAGEWTPTALAIALSLGSASPLVAKKLAVKQASKLGKKAPNFNDIKKIRTDKISTADLEKILASSNRKISGKTKPKPVEFWKDIGKTSLRSAGGSGVYALGNTDDKKEKGLENLLGGAVTGGLIGSGTRFIKPLKEKIKTIKRPENKIEKIDEAIDGKIGGFVNTKHPKIKAEHTDLNKLNKKSNDLTQSLLKDRVLKNNPTKDEFKGSIQLGLRKSGKGLEEIRNEFKPITLPEIKNTIKNTEWGKEYLGKPVAIKNTVGNSYKDLMDTLTENINKSKEKSIGFNDFTKIIGGARNKAVTKDGNPIRGKDEYLFFLDKFKRDLEEGRLNKLPDLQNKQYNKLAKDYGGYKLGSEALETKAIKEGQPLNDLTRAALLSGTTSAFGLNAAFNSFIDFVKSINLKQPEQYILDQLKKKAKNIDQAELQVLQQQLEKTGQTKHSTLLKEAMAQLGVEPQIARSGERENIRQNR